MWSFWWLLKIERNFSAICKDRSFIKHNAFNKFSKLLQRKKEFVLDEHWEQLLTLSNAQLHNVTRTHRLLTNVRQLFSTNCTQLTINNSARKTLILKFKEIFADCQQMAINRYQQCKYKPQQIDFIVLLLPIISVFMMTQQVRVWASLLFVQVQTAEEGESHNKVMILWRLNWNTNTESITFDRFSLHFWKHERDIISTLKLNSDQTLIGSHQPKYACGFFATSWHNFALVSGDNVPVEKMNLKKWICGDDFQLPSKF